MQAHQLTERTVRRALEALLASPTNQEPALLNLKIVDQTIDQMKLAQTPTCRSYALSALLTSLITCRYRLIRAANGLAAPETIQSTRDSFTVIVEDAKTGNIALLGWSWIYTRHVRPELSISANGFCETAGIHVRTLQRYFQRALSQLVAQLIEAECQGLHQHQLIISGQRFPTDRRSASQHHNGEQDAQEWYAASG